jgi:acetylglutamate kinase
MTDAQQLVLINEQIAVLQAEAKQLRLNKLKEVRLEKAAEKQAIKDEERRLAATREWLAASKRNTAKAHILEILRDANIHPKELKGLLETLLATD